VNLNFTKSIDLTIKEIERFLDFCKVILFLEQESIHVKLDNLYLSIGSVQQSQKEELHPLQLAWAAVNVQALRKTVSHFQHKLDSEFKIMIFKEYEAPDRLNLLVNELKQKMISKISIQIDNFLVNYQNQDFL
jgi:hypothetical protein